MTEFFSKEWADAVRDALTAGPDEQARAVKLQEYWDFFDFLKSVYPASWALGCRDLGSYLFVQWADGAVTDCRIIGPDDPLRATYVLGMDYRDWKALHDGYDAQRTVMYRKIMLEQGDLLEFFKAIYFFVESLAIIGAVPAGYADRVDGTLVRLEPAQRHIDPFPGLPLRPRLRVGRGLRMGAGYGHGRSGSAGRLRGAAEQRAEGALDLLGQRVRLPRAGADDPDDGLGVAVQRHLVAGGVDDPPGDPAGPLAGQVGHDRGHVVRGPLVRIGRGAAAAGRHRLGHPGGRAGRDGVHGDAVLAERAGRGPGQADDAHLGGGVVRLAGGAVQAGDRGEVDDAVLRRGVPQ